MLAVELQRGDWVTTDQGQVGRIVHINRLTIFVAFSIPDGDERIDAFLESQLTRTNPPFDRPL